jgi:hypothetical protein
MDAEKLTDLLKDADRDARDYVEGLLAAEGPSS